MPKMMQNAVIFNKKINVAKKLLKMKMTVEQVEEATGLTKKEIEEIKKDI